MSITNYKIDGYSVLLLCSVVGDYFSLLKTDVVEIRDRSGDVIVKEDDNNSLVKVTWASNVEDIFVKKGKSISVSDFHSIYISWSSPLELKHYKIEIFLTDKEKELIREQLEDFGKRYSSERAFFEYERYKEFHCRKSRPKQLFFRICLSVCGYGYVNVIAARSEERLLCYFKAQPVPSQFPNLPKTELIKQIKANEYWSYNPHYDNISQKLSKDSLTFEEYLNITNMWEMHEDSKIAFMYNNFDEHVELVKRLIRPIKFKVAINAPYEIFTFDVSTPLVESYTALKPDVNKCFISALPYDFCFTTNFFDDRYKKNTQEWFFYVEICIRLQYKDLSDKGILSLEPPFSFHVPTYHLEDKEYKERVKMIIENDKLAVKRYLKNLDIVDKLGYPEIKPFVEKDGGLHYRYDEMQQLPVMNFEIIMHDDRSGLAVVLRYREKEFDLNIDRLDVSSIRSWNERNVK